MSVCLLRFVCCHCYGRILAFLFFCSMPLCLQLHYTVIIQLDGKKLYQFVAVIWTQLWYYSDLLFMSINMLHLRSSAHCSIFLEDNINVIGVNSLAQTNKQTTHKLMTRIKSLFWKLSVAWARVDKMHVDPFEISITLSILCARTHQANKHFQFNYF